LPGQLLGADFVEQADQPVHEIAFRKILRRTGPCRGVVRPGAAPGVEVVVHLEPPHPAVDPFADLAEAPELRVKESAVNVDHGGLGPEFPFRGPADELLP